MTSAHVVRQAFAMRAAGIARGEIATALGLTVRTLGRWWQVGEDDLLGERRLSAAGELCPARCPARPRAEGRAYAYLLGQYLGDGWIAATRRGVYRLSIACCAAYPGIVDDVSTAMHDVVPQHSVMHQRRGAVCVVSMCSKHWPCLFPQHGTGPKHTRPIRLEPWQSRLALEQHPGPFIRGLIHSDGCRCANRVSAPNGQRYVYPRYLFTNASADIRRLFCAACDALGVDWRRMNDRNISVARRASVDQLDRYVGPKT